MTNMFKIFCSGAIEPEYVVTADDVGKLLSVECIPMDDQGHMVYIQNDDSVMSFVGPFCSILFMTEKLKTGR